MFSGDLSAWLAHLESLHASEIDLGLSRIATVAKRLQLPLSPDQRFAKVITFAGTNGKGSTLAMTQAVLQAAGWRVGSYTSPHFLCFNERIQINGCPVDDARLVNAFEQIEQARCAAGLAEVSLTYFEFATLAALVIFSAAPLDVWLLEVGLGGRLDAVNLVDTDIAVITRLGLDHQAWLGDDLESIGREKAGILRPGIAVVLGDDQWPYSVLDQAAKLGCEIVQLGKAYTQQLDLADQWFWVKENQRVGPLPRPGLPLNNAATALQIVSLMGVTLEAQWLAPVMQQVSLSGRMSRSGAWLMDVAHNPQAAKYLAEQLQRFPCRRLAVVGMMADKDIEATLEPLLPSISDWVCLSLPTPRAASADQLAEVLRALGGTVVLIDEGDQASQARAWIDQALAAQHYDEVLVFGSFFTLALFPDKLPLLQEGSCATG